MKPIPCTLMACLALTLASCGKTEDTAPPAASSSGSVNAPSAGGVASVTLTGKEAGKEPAKEPVKEPANAPADEELVARTPASSPLSEADASKAKAQAQAEPNAEAPKPGQPAAGAPAAPGAPATPAVAARPPETPAKPAELPKPFLGEGFEARAADGDDGTRAALDKLLNKAPLTAPVQAPPSPPAPASPPPQR